MKYWGGAEAEVQDIVEIGEVLRAQGLIETVLGLQSLLRGLGDGFLTNKGPARYSVHDKKSQSKYDPDCKYSQDQSLDDVADCFGIHRTRTPFRSVLV